MQIYDHCPSSYITAGMSGRIYHGSDVIYDWCLLIFWGFLPGFGGVRSPSKADLACLLEGHAVSVLLLLLYENEL